MLVWKPPSCFGGNVWISALMLETIWGKPTCEKVSSPQNNPATCQNQLLLTTCFIVIKGPHFMWSLTSLYLRCTVQCFTLVCMLSNHTLLHICHWILRRISIRAFMSHITTWYSDLAALYWSSVIKQGRMWFECFFCPQSWNKLYHGPNKHVSPFNI